LAEFWGRNARSKAGQERPRLEEKAHTVSQWWDSSWIISWKVSRSSILQLGRTCHLSPKQVHF
jgi:hypothetical protein